MTVKKQGRTKLLLWAGLLAAAMGAFVWTLRPRPIPSTMAVVTRGALVSTVSGEGRTRVRDLFIVAAPVDGELDRISVHPADAIQLDDPVAFIRPATSRPLDPRTRAEASAAAAAARAAVARADASEQEARVALEHATSELETSRRLAQTGAVPSEEVTHRGHEADMRRSALEASTAAAGQTRAELTRALALLGNGSDPGRPMPVRSPVRGTVLRLARESAGPVAAGAPLLEVGDVTRLEVDADLLSSDAAEVRQGAAGTVTGWGGSNALRARVRRIDPAAFTKVSALGLEEQRVHVILDLTDPPPAGLGHDYRVDVSVVVWQGEGVLRVPSTALFRSGDRWAVFRVTNSRARKVLVELGATDGTSTVVTSGLGGGDEVITQPSDAIDDGTRVSRR
jgi:HlyD family secretion protein